MNTDVQKYVDYFQGKVIGEYQKENMLPAKQAELHQRVVQGWSKLYKKLHVKYNDGFLNDIAGLGQFIGYPEEWLVATGFDESPTPKYVSPIKNAPIVAK